MDQPTINFEYNMHDWHYYFANGVGVVCFVHVIKVIPIITWLVIITVALGIVSQLGHPTTQ